MSIKYNLASTHNQQGGDRDKTLLQSILLYQQSYVSRESIGHCVWEEVANRSLSRQGQTDSTDNMEGMVSLRRVSYVTPTSYHER